MSCDYHDAAAAVVVDGEVLAAAEEERFSRRKHDSSLPQVAIASCLAQAGLGADDLDLVVFHEKPLVVAGRVLAARQRRGPAAMRTLSRELPPLLAENLLVGYRLERTLSRLGATKRPRIRYCEHHLSHAAAAFLPSPFESAAVLTVDGIGEWATVAVGLGEGRRVELLEEQRFPSSLGLLYSLVTVWCGFEANDGEYKLMGLAPYGKPRFADALAQLVERHQDGSFTVDTEAVRWWGGRPERMKRLVDLFDGPPAAPGSPPTRRHADLARSMQDLTEEIVLGLAHRAHERTGLDALCMAGGVALNCVANGRLVREGPFAEVWVQPAAGDAGSAIGAALWATHDEAGHPRRRAASGEDRTSVDDAMRGALLGPDFSDEEVTAWLDSEGVEHQLASSEEDLVASVAGALAAGECVGWFQGRMEFGPRALGNRSILADPRSPTVQRDLNLRVKGRESFRPFAPSVLAEAAADWFEMDRPSPYMLVTWPVRGWVPSPTEDGSPEDPLRLPDAIRSPLPACTHVDGSARVQTVHAESNPRYHALISAFADLTGCPVLVNTSFNVAGEPIVATPEDALRTARAAGLDLLVLGSVLVPLGRPTEEVSSS